MRFPQISGAPFVVSAARLAGSRQCLRRMSDIVITGTTNSDDFPTTSGAYQEIRAGSRDIFVSFVAFVSENNTSTTTSTANGTQSEIDFLLIAGGLTSAVVIVSLIVIMKIKR